MVESMAIVLASCPQVCTHQAILEQVLAWVHCPILTWVSSASQWVEAGMWQVTTRFYTFLQAELGKVKISNTQKATLVRKGNITSSCYKDCWQVLSQILGIAHHNLSRAVEQRQLVQKFSLLERRKKKDGVSAKTKNLVILWWIVDTQVSPNKKKCHM
jgi:hypothetical protein